ncbi:MAG: alpha/beta hydrolase [Bacillota bacterium]|jgi:predicted alpha/beta superfamily hydrolase
MTETRFTAGGREILLIPALGEDAPFILLHTFNNEGRTVYDLVRRDTAADFSFAAVSGLRWDDDMSPWPIPPIAKGDTPCGGRADDYLKTLTGEILPSLRAVLPTEPAGVYLAGYSLAGLFSVYALYRAAVFDGAVSASGSFWYPDFLAFAKGRSMKKPPERIYLSLGDKEAKTRNRVLRPVEENTAALAAHFAERGIETVFELNPGNHFQRCDERVAKGILWLLRR